MPLPFTEESIGLASVAGFAFASLILPKAKPKLHFRELPAVPFELRPSTADFLRRYWKDSSITDSEIKQKVLEFQQRALEVCNYPCLQRYQFVIPKIFDHPIYSSLIEPRIQDVTVLDIGSCMGTDLRALISKGAKPANIAGIEIEEEFIRLGFEFFADESEIMRRMFHSTSALIDSPVAIPQQLEPFKKRFDFVYLGNILHLLSLAEQKSLLTFVEVVCRPGAVVFGTFVGSPTIYTEADGRYIHSKVSLQDMFETSQTYKHVTVDEVHPSNVELICPGLGPDLTEENRTLLTFSFTLD